MEGVIKHLRQKQFDVIKAPIDTGGSVVRNAEGKERKKEEIKMKSGEEGEELRCKSSGERLDKEEMRW